MLGIDYICFTNFSGYGVAAKNYIKALHATGHYDIKVTPIDFDFQRKGRKEDLDFLRPLIEKKSHTDRVRVLHCLPDMYRRFKSSQKTVGLVVYETTSPPAHWIAILNTVDAVIVPSVFNHKIFSDGGIDRPMYYIPHCVNMKIYQPNVRPMYSWDKFTFLFIGSWKHRKGYVELIEAWLQEFSVNEHVQLVIKTDRPAKGRAYLSKLQKRVLKAASIVIEDKHFTESEMATFIKSSDCFITPSRGEGFGLGNLQAMALGVPVITTNYGGVQDYANTKTANMIEIEGFVVEKCLDGVPQFTNKKWAVVSVDSIRQSMRSVYSEYDTAKEKSAAAQSFVSNRFGYEQISTKFDNLFCRMLGDDHE